MPLHTHADYPERLLRAASPDHRAERSSRYGIYETTLLEARRRLEAGDPILVASLELLRKDADQALATLPISVTDKSHTPSSGDNRDYVSLGLYWWPDPDANDGIPYIRRDGQGNPNSDIDRERIRRMCESVQTLLLAYWLTNDPSYARHGTRFVETWFLDSTTRMNPNMQFAQAIPGKVDGREVGLIDGHYLIDLIPMFAALERFPHWSSEQHRALREWFHTFLLWLIQPERTKYMADQAHNISVAYDALLCAIGLFVGERELVRQVALTVPARMVRQIEPDGRQPLELARTRAMNYAQRNLRHHAEIAMRSCVVGVNLWAFEDQKGVGLRVALDWLSRYADGKAEWPYQQIVPKPWPQIATLFRKASLGYQNPNYEALVRRVPEVDWKTSRFNLLYPPLEPSPATATR